MKESPLALALRAEIAPDRVLTRPIDLVRYAADASAYLLRPVVVVIAASVADVQAVLRIARRFNVPLTFRAAGTSLSGQSQTDGILVEVQRHWRGLTIEGYGARVRVLPGTVAATVNTALHRHGTQLGPDPASIGSCTVGGIIANNASGMCCGVAHNGYHTLESMTFVLASGVTIDSADPDSAGLLAAQAPELVEGLTALRKEVLADVDLATRIRTKFAIKNTTGYAINALVDFETPLDMLTHLMVGSEGTLGFVAEVVLRTVPAPSRRLTALLLFPDLGGACSAVAGLDASGAAAIELMDVASLRAVEDETAQVVDLATLNSDTTALLVEWRAADDASLATLTTSAERAIGELTLAAPAVVGSDAGTIDRLWAIRKGLLASVGAHRPGGTSVILEDIVFPAGELLAGTTALRALLDSYGYAGVIFGHARDGNLHFLVSEALGEPDQVARYAAFMADLVELVIGHGGSLKGEHGTGRNMAPFVEAEWGATAYALMCEIKRLADPHGILNPGSVIATSNAAHIEHLKSIPLVDPETDRCVECGFCERACPSGDLTATPRQRIVIRREVARLREEDAASPWLRSIEEDSRHDVVDTCAVDGMCELSCPVGINTGQLVKRLRQESHSAPRQRAGKAVARRFGSTERVARGGLRVGAALERWWGPALPSRLSRLAARPLARLDLVPQWIAGTPGPPARGLPSTDHAAAHAVYLPSCVNRIFGGPSGQPGDVPTVPEALTAVAARAGRPVWIPPDVNGTCCTTPWVSKGYRDGAQVMAERMIDRLWEWTHEGRLPVISDASSCAGGLREMAGLLSGEAYRRHARLTVLDSIEYVGALLGSLDIEPVSTVHLHPTCSTHRSGTSAALETIVSQLATDVRTSEPARCCGFGGDRGFLHPELTASATREMAARVEPGLPYYLSSNRPCEIGMQQATGQPWQSYLIALERQSRPRVR